MFGPGKRSGSLDVLRPIVDAQNLASKFLRQENRGCSFATGYIENTACGIQAQHAPELFRQLQAARVEGVAQEKPGQVALVQVGAALLNLRLLTVNANWVVKPGHESPL
jgi:hypothetical protein